ncbi:MAG: metal-binding protein, partial [Zetaproteobacteria bacterium CG_4_8_14_3_um_filter_59_5]
MLGLAAFDMPTAQAMAEEVVMYKSPSCGCCSGWADTLKSAGFSVVEHKTDDMDVIKVKYGVSDRLSSCHTALVGGYIIEGHVPAADVKRLLREKPAGVVGLTA